MLVLRISNSAGEVPVTTVLREARFFWARFRGLMLRPPPADCEGLRIEPCSSIHMMFMRFPIDAVFYDREHRVTRVARDLRPWVGLAFGGKGARGVIELPRGAAQQIQPGDLLSFETT